MAASPSEEIKGKLDIVEFINFYVKLQKAGKNYKGCCPFHSEKTPSFVVSPDRQIWHCFGCGQGGDVFKFLMLHEGLEFHEALKILAEKAGVELRRVSPAQQKEFGVLYDLTEAAKEFFKKELSQFQEGKSYLISRGLQSTTVSEFEIGWAPGGESLTIHLINLGHGIEDIRRAGLTIKTESGLYRDKFQRRIMFPILNNFGKPVGFTGRILPKYENDKTPKYLNSPETPIFNKSRLLYGLSKSRSEITKTKEVFLVEGQMDFLMVWQSGIKNVVASSGTALGTDHLNALQRIADTLIVSFDQDEAGLKALERVLDLTSNFDFTVKALDLGNFKDPAEAALADSEALGRSFNSAKPALAKIFNHHLNSLKIGLSDLAAKKRTLRLLLAKIKKLRSPIDQSHWLKELSTQSGVEEKALALELNSIQVQGNYQTSDNKDSFVSEELGRRELIAERVLSLALLKDNFMTALADYREYFPEKFQKLLDNPSAVASSEAGIKLSLRSSYEFSELEEKRLNNEFNDLLKNLKQEYFYQQCQTFKNEITLAEKSRDEGKVEELSRKLQAASRELHSLK